MEKRINRRAFIIFSLFLGTFFALLIRLVIVQILQGDILCEKAENQGRLHVKLLPWRGTIYDRNGKELAISVSADSICVRPSEVEKPDEASLKIAEVLNEDLLKVKKKLTSDRPFVWLKRKAEKRKAQMVKSISGVGIIEESKRSYPAGMLASHLIGFSGMDNCGLEGIEFTFDRYLRGMPGYLRSKTDARGRELATLRYADKAPDEGKGLMLTIDEVIQYLVERELDRAYSTEPAQDGSRIRVKGVSAIVMRTSTGEILALANRPTFNPANFGLSSFDERRNRAVTDIFEPGSCFKIIPAAAALEEGLFRPEDEIFCENGSFRLPGHTIHDVHPYGLLTFRQVLVKSSNIGASKISAELGEMRFYRYIRRFGFGEKTGSGLPGETAGLLRHPGRWSKLSISMLSFGQEIGVSSIQLISAFSAVANGGVLMQPMVVKSLIDGNGNVSESFSPRRRRRVISEESARTLTEILVGVVEKGTGKRARIPGYKVAGKTGTAQKIEKGTYSHTKFVSSFVGYVPAYKPEIAILVVVDEPCGKPSECYGGRVAGPVFRRIAVQTLKYLGIPPEGTETRFAANTPAQLNTVGAATHVVSRSGPACRRGMGNPYPYAEMLKVKDNTYYKAEAEFVNDCYLTLKEGTDIRKAEVYMPDVYGMTMREVLRMLAPYQLKIKFAGSGVAVRQSPHAGKKIHPGTKCSITFRNK